MYDRRRNQGPNPAAVDERRDIAQYHFKTTNDILIFPEIRLGNVGNIDFVMVRHKPMSTEIVDFAGIEFQAGQTTSTGQLVQGFKDFLLGHKVHTKSYEFGLNLYDIWKRTFTQILNKGTIMEGWRKKIYWVLQVPVYRNFEKRYSLQNLKLNKQHSITYPLPNS